MNYKRDLIMPLLERLQMAFSSTVPEVLLKAMVESGKYQVQQHKEYMKYIKLKQQEQIAILNGSALPAHINANLNSNNQNNQSKKTSEDFEFDFHFADQWKEIRPYFPIVADLATTILERMRGIKVIFIYIVIFI